MIDWGVTMKMTTTTTCHKDKQPLKWKEIVTQTNFLQLTLDIPEKLLFKDEEGGLVNDQNFKIKGEFFGTTITTHGNRDS
jgi:hypothetical protein